MKGQNGPDPIFENAAYRSRLILIGVLILAASISQPTQASNSLSNAFSAPISYPLESSAQAVAIADLNQDGRQDVIVGTSSGNGSTNDNSILIFFQNSSGQLKAPVRYDAGGQAASVVTGDFTGDHLIDIVAGTGLALRLFIQDSGGSFSNYVDYPTPNSRWICSADFNNDGRSDVAGISWNSQEVDVFTQTTNGTLEFAGQHQAAYSGYNDLKAGDVNGDGLSDIIVMNGQSFNMPEIIVLTQTNGGFAPAANYDLIGNDRAYGISIGDLTGDGRNDVIVCHAGSPSPFPVKVSVFEQSTNGLLQLGPAYDSSYNPDPVVIADFDFDGRADFVALHGDVSRAGVYFQTFPGAFEPEIFFDIPFASQLPTHGLAVGDVNGDKMPDIVIANYTEDAGLVLLTNRLTLPVFKITDLSLDPSGRALLTASYAPGQTQSCMVEVSETLTNWTTVGAMSGNIWIDTNSPVYFTRFYRLVAP